MTTQLNIWQQTYALSIITGSAAGVKDTVAKIEESLTANIEAFYANNVASLGTWTTAWGPVVTSEDGYADNAMYVVTDNDSGAGPTTLLVGIAGTNFHSKKYDVGEEDLDVGKTVLFSDLFSGSTEAGGFPRSPRVSAGTAYGVRALWGMKSQGAILRDYLKGVDNKSDTTLIFAGHSLGGALCPVLAAALFDSALGGLDSGEWANVYTYPTAGPTPGNVACAELIGRSFPSVAGDDYKVWNCNVCNPYDIVPHAWNEDTLEEIKTLYSTYPYSDAMTHKDVLDGLVDVAKVMSAKGAVVAGAYTQLQCAFLAGATPQNDTVTNMGAFMKEAFYQHTVAYDKLLGLGGLVFPGKSLAARSAVEMLLRGASSAADEMAEPASSASG